MAEKEAKKKNPWDEKWQIHLPRAGKNEEKFVLVRINARTFQVPKGRLVEVPKPVYDRLMIMLAAQEKADEYAISVENGGNAELAYKI